MQDRNHQELGFSSAKVYDARSRSPAKKYAGSSFVGATAATSHYAAAVDKSSSPPRRYAAGGSPLRSSYKPTYGRYWSLLDGDFSFYNKWNNFIYTFK